MSPARKHRPNTSRVADELCQGSPNRSYISLVALLSRSWPLKGRLASARDTHCRVGIWKLRWKQASPKQQYLCLHSHQLRVGKKSGLCSFTLTCRLFAGGLMGFLIAHLSFLLCLLRGHRHLRGAAGTEICITHTTYLFCCPRICSGLLQLALSQAKSKHSSGVSSSQGPLPVSKSLMSNTSSPLMSSTW